MSIERTYGNDSQWLNARRVKYGNTINTLGGAVIPVVMERDCVTCDRCRSGRIPHNNKCQVICGSGKVKLTKGKEDYAKLKAKKQNVQ